MNPTRLLVDFRDGISPEALRATGYEEIAAQRLLEGRRPLHHRLPDRRRGRRGARQAGREPRRRERRLRRGRHHLPRRGVAGGRRRGRRGPRARRPGSSLEAECNVRAPTAKGFPNDACFKYQWHLRQIGMPGAWKQGNGKGAIVAVIDTGVTKVGDLADTNSSPATTSSPTTPTRLTTTATARTSPGPSPSRPTTASAWRASPTARPSCRSRCSRRAARGRWAASRRRSAGPPTTAPTSST